MPIIAHAQKGQVRAAGLTEALLEQPAVLEGSLIGIDLPTHAMDVLRRNRHFAEQGEVRHVEIALGRIGRDGAFVAEEDLDAWPIDTPTIDLTGEQFVERPGGRTAGERQGETAGMRDGSHGGGNDLLRRLLGQGLDIGNNIDVLIGSS